MTETLVGTGGWSYLTDDALSLKKYSQYFRFVETNSTFYSYPPNSALTRWRRQVPAEFVFTVKAHQDVSHHLRFVPSTETYEACTKLNQICERLSAEVIVFQCPPSLKLSDKLRVDFSDLFHSVNLRARIAVEVRSPKSSPGRLKFSTLLGDMGFVEVVDLSRERPRNGSDLLYSRIFGPGQGNLYQFSNEELRRLHHDIDESKSKRAYMVFHTIGMYFDAVRMQNYESGGNFLPLSQERGISSVRKVIGSDFTPAWRRDLIIEHGWKLCEWTEERQVRLSQILIMIPEKLYLTRNELLDALSKVQL